MARTERPRMLKTVYKPTEENTRLLLLTGDVQFHVIRFVRGETMPALVRKEPFGQSARAKLATAIIQTKQLLATLQKIGETLK